LNRIDNYMSANYEPEFSVPNKLLMEWDKAHYIPFFYDGEVELIRIFEVEDKSCLPMSMREMLDFGIDPFEDLSAMYDLDEEDE